jgi:hypothetical protein
MAEAAAAREAVSLARRRDELMSSILPEIDSMVMSLTERQASSFDSIDDALREAERRSRSAYGEDQPAPSRSSSIGRAAPEVRTGKVDFLEEVTSEARTWIAD